MPLGFWVYLDLIQKIAALSYKVNHSPPPFFFMQNLTLENISACTDINPQALLKQKDFICLLLVCGILMGGQCAIISLLAQIFLPPFYGLMDEKYVGILGSVMLAVGSIASLCVGCYLDRTPKYKELSRFLSLTATLTVMGLFVCIELGSLIGAIISWYYQLFQKI